MSKKWDEHCHQVEAFKKAASCLASRTNVDPFATLKPYEVFNWQIKKGQVMVKPKVEHKLSDAPHLMRINNEVILHLEKHDTTGLFFPEEVVVDTLKRKEVLGCVGMPLTYEDTPVPLTDAKYEDFMVSLENVSHYATNFRIQNGCLLADIVVLNTPCGKQLAEWYESTRLEDNHPIFRTSSLVEFTDAGNGDAIMTFFKLISVNAIPAVEDSWKDK